MTKKAVDINKVTARNLRVLADRLESGAIVILALSARAGTKKVPPMNGALYDVRKLTGRRTLTIQFREATNE